MEAFRRPGGPRVLVRETRALQSQAYENTRMSAKTLNERNIAGEHFPNVESFAYKVENMYLRGVSRGPGQSESNIQSRRGGKFWIPNIISPVTVGLSLGYMKHFIL